MVLNGKITSKVMKTVEMRGIFMEIVSIESLKNLADKGNSDACYELGIRYYKGIGVRS